MLTSGKSRGYRARLSTRSLAAACVAAALLNPLVAEALAPNCREIVFDGAAGIDYMDDKVVFRVVTPSGTLLSESCEFTVKDGESAVDFLRRIPRQWGSGKGGSPASDLQCRSTCSAGKVGAVCGFDSDCDVVPPPPERGICGVETKKSCNSFNDQPSCRVEVKISQNSGVCVISGTSCKGALDCRANNDECLTSPDHSGRVRGCSNANPPLVAGETCLKKPAVLRVCCKEEPGCSGPKLGTNQPAALAITVQTKLNPKPSPAPTCDVSPPYFCPGSDDLPAPGSELRTVVLDPISAITTPYKEVAKCRKAIGGEVAKLTKVVVDTLTSCHAIGAPSVDCNSVNPQSDADGDIAKAETGLREKVAGKCATSGKSPASFGFKSCPQPCESVAVGTCSAGSVGSPCQNDPTCDTAPGMGDGRCGDWNVVSDCLICQASNASVQTILALYSPTPPAPVTQQAGPPALVTQRAGGATQPLAELDPAALACRQAIEDAVSWRLKLNLDETNRCQEKVDAAKLLLPERTPKCRDADPKGKRALADTITATALQTACTPTALGQLNTCSSNLAGLKACTKAVVKRANDLVAEAAAPEQVCGDGKIGVGELCDDGNVTDGDGCDSNCAPTGCGNGVITSGEQCDDGNTTSGDGCDATCIAEPTPCGAQVCGAYTFDCSPLFPGQCLCLQTAEGGGACVNNFDCASAPSCSQTTPDCLCYVNTCCGGGKCGPPTCTGSGH
jgi:cysteine-rich repeat protein